MAEILQTLSEWSILVFAVTSMLAAGFSYTFREIVAPLRDANRVARALIGNFVLVPLLAAVIVRAFELDPALELGFILLGTAAGAPFLVKLVAIAEAEIALGTALLVLLVPTTVVFMPLVVPVLAPDTDVSAASIAVPLALSLVLPLVVGLGTTEKAPRWAARLQPIVRRFSSIALVVLLASTVLLNLRGLVDILTSRAVFALVIFVLGAFAIGYLIASPHAGRRAVLGLGTAQRNIAAATVVAAEGFRGPETLVLVVVASVVTLGVLIPVARWLRGGIDAATGSSGTPGLAGSRV